MAHFAISCPPLPGHINPFCALGRELVRRGNRVTVFGIADTQSMVEKQGLRFVALGAKEYPVGSLTPFLTALKQQQGYRSMTFVLDSLTGLLRRTMEHAPAAFLEENVDAVLADQNEPAAASVAQHLDLPFASICTSLPLNREPAIPPSFTSWEYGTGPLSILRNRIGYTVGDFITRRIQATLNEFRAHWRLRELRSPDDSFSSIAQVAQMPAEFDFPRRNAPSCFHYTGPWFDEVNDGSSRASAFPFERLDGRPLLYA